MLSVEMVKRGVKISFGDRYIERLVVNAEKNGNIPDVRSCFSLLSYQRRAEKKSFICVNWELKGEVSPEYMRLEVIHI